MNKEKDFFKTCFNTVAGLEVKNESQAIAKEVILDEVENLLEENKQLKADLEVYENGVYFSSENDKLENEIDNLNHIIDKQDKDITILSKGNKHLKEVIDKAIEYIENENLRIVDISKEIPELCDGELLKILKGDSNE